MMVALAAIAAVIALGGGDDGPAASMRQQQEQPPPAATPPPARQESIEPAGITEHLRALARAAGLQRTRAAGSPGDRATARYIATRLHAAGYRVSEQTFRVPLFLERRPARIRGMRR